LIIAGYYYLPAVIFVNPQTKRDKQRRIRNARFSAQLNFSISFDRAVSICKLGVIVVTKQSNSTQRNALHYNAAVIIQSQSFINNYVADRRR